MNRTVALSALLLLTWSCGCVDAIFPFYTEKDVIYEPKLLGRWDSHDAFGKRVFQFKLDGGLRPEFRSLPQYSLESFRVNERGRVSDRRKYVATLMRVNGKLYLDIAPPRPNPESGLLATHRIVRISRIGKSTLSFASPNGEKLLKKLGQIGISVRHLPDHHPILAADTKKLQEAFCNDDVWGVACDSFHRVSAKKESVHQKQTMK